ncbi:MAG TPA: HAD family hydrolase [Thermoplasmata archaeon]|nr:HAD family hydrolase [Thermoplasmata archaeon]
MARSGDAPEGPRKSARHSAPGTVRAVFFDFDDTLFDHTRSLVDGIRALRASEPRVSARPLGQVVRRYERLLDAIQPGKPGGPRTHPEARAARFRLLDAWLGGPGDPETAEAWSATYRAAYQAARRPVRGAVPLLRGLHGRVCVGVVTNNHTAEQIEKIQALHLERWIDFMVTSEDVGVQKPHPAIFRAALKKSGVPAAETTMVGDSWASDVLGATGAGLRAVWLRRRGRRPPGLPDVRVLRSFTPVRASRRVLLTAVPGARPVGGRRGPAEPYKNVKRHEALSSHGHPR